MEPHHLNKNPFVRHMKDAVPPLHRTHLGAWESTSTENGQALDVQLVSAYLLGLRGLCLCPGLSGWRYESCCFLKFRTWQMRLTDRGRQELCVSTQQTASPQRQEAGMLLPASIKF